MHAQIALSNHDGQHSAARKKDSGESVMSFTLRGVLSASVCEDCPISLAGAAVRVYATLPNQGVTARAAADPRHTFRLFHHAGDEDRAALEAAHGELLGEAIIGADGAYTVELAASYGGDAVDIDLYCGTVSGHVPPRPTQVADRKSTRLNSSHPSISYAVFCLKKKKPNRYHYAPPNQINDHIIS